MARQEEIDMLFFSNMNDRYRTRGLRFLGGFYIISIAFKNTSLFLRGFLERSFPIFCHYKEPRADGGTVSTPDTSFAF